MLIVLDKLAIHKAVWLNKLLMFLGGLFKVSHLMLILTIGCTTAMNSPTQANAGEHFEIVRETVLPNNWAFGFSINDAANGSGYIITGAISGHQAWARRVDPQGNEIWSYAIPKDVPEQYQDVPVSWRSSQYKSAVTLKNGNTLLCGHKDMLNHREARDGTIMGLLTRIDAKGQFIDQRLLSPHGDSKYSLNYIVQCGSWGDGYFVAGSSSRYIQNLPGKSQPFVGEKFFWLMALDANGEIKWEKLISKGFSASPASKLPWQMMPNGDLIFSGSAPSIREKDSLVPVTSILRIGLDGEVKAQRTITGGMMLVRQPRPAQAIRLIPFNLNDVGMFLLTLNDDLSDASRLTSDKKDEFAIQQAIEMPDHSILLAGGRDYRNTYATLIHYSPDLRQSNNFVFKPKGASYWLDDAMIIGMSNEFVAIRSLKPEFNKNIFTIMNLK